jgi:glyceraldehyde 3-phosphate dehydrogenase
LSKLTPPTSVTTSAGIAEPLFLILNGAVSMTFFYEEEPLVSVDFNRNKLSSIVDASCTTVIRDKMVRILSWYDNETGFSNRVIDLLKLIQSKN